VCDALAFVGLPVFAYVTRNLAWMRFDRHWATTVFHDAVLFDAVAAGVAIGAGVAALLVLALRIGHQLRLVALALPCAMLGVGSARAVRHADSLAAVGSMPFYAIEGQRELHVRREHVAHGQRHRHGARRHRDSSVS
jgi:hypothetical protein